MYKYINIWISYDKVADKMNRLAAQGYEYDKEYLVAVRMKKHLKPMISNISLSMIKISLPKQKSITKLVVGSFISLSFIIFLGLLKEIQIRIQYLQILKRNLKLLDIDC